MQETIRPTSELNGKVRFGESWTVAAQFLWPPLLDLSISLGTVRAKKSHKGQLFLYQQSQLTQMGSISPKTSIGKMKTCSHYNWRLN